MKSIASTERLEQAFEISLMVTFHSRQCFDKGDIGSGGIHNNVKPREAYLLNRNPQSRLQLYL